MYPVETLKFERAANNCSKIVQTCSFEDLHYPTNRKRLGNTDFGADFENFHKK